MKKYLIPYTIIAFLVGWIIYDIVRKDEVTTVSDKTEVTFDSTYVDSLTQRIRYLEDIEDPDTVEVVVRVPVPVETQEGYNRYEPSYSDSILSAHWGLTVDGVIVEEIEFEYFIKRQWVQEEVTTFDRMRVIERTRTITQRIEPRGYFSVGGFTGIVDQRTQAGASLMYTTKNRQSYYVNYDVLNEGVTVGVTIPLSLRGIFR